MLKIALKPKERVYINGSVIENGGKTNSSLNILNKTHVLRERDVMTPEQALDGELLNSKLVYFIGQQTILNHPEAEKNAIEFRQAVSKLYDIYSFNNDIVNCLDKAIAFIDNKNYYKALKELQIIQSIEKDLILKGQDIKNNLDIRNIYTVVTAEKERA